MLRVRIDPRLILWGKGNSEIGTVPFVPLIFGKQSSGRYISRVADTFWFCTQILFVHITQNDIIVLC